MHICQVAKYKKVFDIFENSIFYQINSSFISGYSIEFFNI